MGAKNINPRYRLGGEPLGELRMENNLRVLVDDRLSNSIQCQAATSKTSRQLACIKKGKINIIIIPLYT